MINYIKSEFYRTLKNKNFKIMCGIFVGLIVTLVILLHCMNKVDSSFPYGNTKFALSNVYAQMTMLFTVIVAFAAIVDNSEYSNNTIKHSVSFGIKRNTIYLGRLIVQAILGVLVYVVMSVLLITLAFTFLEHSNANEINHYIRVSIGGGTCLLSVLAVTHFFIMNNDNIIFGLIFPVIIMVIVPSVLNMIGRKIDVVMKIAKNLPYNLIDFHGDLVQGTGGVSSYLMTSLIGLIWIVIFILWGMYLFNKKEIR